MKGKGLKVMPLGGLEEIGKNMLVLEYGKEIIVVDCGLKFPGARDFGANHSICDFTYLRERAKQVKGILITHGHLDHIGGLDWLLKEVRLPVYSDAFAGELIRRRLKERGLEKAFKGLNVFEGEKGFVLGEHFRVVPLPMDHSIPKAFGLVIETPVGVVVHTGDYYVEDRRVLGRFRKHLKGGCLALFGDSTNADKERPGASELVVLNNLKRLMKRASGRLIVGMFSTQLGRVLGLLGVAAQMGRKVCFLGRSMVENVGIGVEMGFFKGFEDVIIDERKLRSTKLSKVVIVCTGTQGEEYSVLAKIAAGRHRLVRVRSSDCFVFSSSVVPGNELEVGEVVNGLLKLGAEVVQDSEGMEVHRSGHATVREIGAVIKAVRPKYFFPVHGEFIHLKKCREVAVACGVPERNVVLMENGSQVFLGGSEGLSRGRSLRLREVFVSANGSGFVAPKGMVERRSLMESGVVFLSLLAAEKGGMPSSVGCTVLGYGGKLEDQVEPTITEYLKGFWPEAMNRRRDLDNDSRWRRWIEGRFADHLSKTLGLRPEVRVHLLS